MIAVIMVALLWAMLVAGAVAGLLSAFGVGSADPRLMCCAGPALFLLWLLVLAAGSLIFRLSNAKRKPYEPLRYPSWFPFRPIQDRPEALTIWLGPSALGVAGVTYWVTAVVYVGVDGMMQDRGFSTAPALDAVFLAVLCLLSAGLGYLWARRRSRLFVFDFKGPWPVFGVVADGKTIQTREVTGGFEPVVRYVCGGAGDLGWQLFLRRPYREPPETQTKKTGIAGLLQRFVGLRNRHADDICIVGGFCFFPVGFPYGKRGFQILAERISERCGLQSTDPDDPF